jgi:hypothetical protein
VTRSAIATFCLASYFLIPAAAAQSPRVELDHLYIVVAPGGVNEIAALRTAGLEITPAQKHEGEGTTSVAALFENGYIELMWLDSSLSVTPEHAAAVRQFRKAAAWRVSGHSPFGVGLRRLPGEKAAFSFRIAREPAPWIDPDAAYEILNQSADSLAVDLFVVPAGAAVPNWIGRVRERFPERLRHPGGGHEITRVRVYGPVSQQPSIISVLRPARIDTRIAAEPLVEVFLDGGVQKSRIDLRPVLPIVLVR